MEEGRPSDLGHQPSQGPHVVTWSSPRSGLRTTPSPGPALIADLQTSSSTSPQSRITTSLQLPPTSPSLPASSTASLLIVAHSCEKVWWSTSPLSAPHHLETQGSGTGSPSSPVSVASGRLQRGVLTKVGHPPGETKLDQVLFDQLLVPDSNR